MEGNDKLLAGLVALKPRVLNLKIYKTHTATHTDPTFCTHSHQQNDLKDYDLKNSRCNFKSPVCKIYRDLLAECGKDGISYSFKYVFISVQSPENNNQSVFFTLEWEVNINRGHWPSVEEDSPFCNATFQIRCTVINSRWGKFNLTQHKR